MCGCHLFWIDFFTTFPVKNLNLLSTSQIYLLYIFLKVALKPWKQAQLIKKNPEDKWTAMTEQLLFVWYGVF